VDERSRILMAALGGAVAGAVVGYLYLTEGGRRFRGEIEPRLDEFIGEMRKLRGAVNKARAAAHEGWQSLAEVAGGEGDWQQSSGQNTPF
jgi:hypothetical protein